MNAKILIGAAAAVLIVLGGYFLLKSGLSKEGAPSGPAGGEEGIVISGTEFSFAPAKISVKAGESAKIVFRNKGASSHNLMIEGMEIGTEVIAGGKEAALEFTPASKGTYKFYCSVPGHREAGMEGVLTVE